MALMLSVHFSRAFVEIFLPPVNNRVQPLDIPRAISGLPHDLHLQAEVWNGAWFLVSSGEVAVEGAPEKGVPVADGQKYRCLCRATGRQFIVLAGEVRPGDTRFGKYLLPRGPVRIGSGEGCDIRYNRQGLVSASHASLELLGDGRCLLHDLDSRNGTFVNGRRIGKEYLLSYGDLIYIMGLKLVWLGGVLAVNEPEHRALGPRLAPFVPAPADEPTPRSDAPPAPREGDTGVFYTRTPRRQGQMDREPVEIEAPPAPTHHPRRPLFFTIGPSLTMVLPMLAGVLFTLWSAQQSGGSQGVFMFMGLVTALVSAVVGIFWALANYRYQKTCEIEAEQQRQSAYRAYIGRLQAVLERRCQDNLALLSYQYPDTAECLGWCREGQLRLWERNCNHADFLTLRLGLGSVPSPIPIAVPKDRFSLSEDPLASLPGAVKAAFSQLSGAPVTVSLAQHPLIGVVARDGDTLLETARSLCVQLTACHCYTDVKLVIFFRPAHREQWAFARFLPHVWVNGVRMMACDSAGTGEVMYALSAALRQRLPDREEDAPAERPLPHYVVLIEDPELVQGEPLMKYLGAPTPEMGVTTLLLYEKVDRLPNNCTPIVENGRDFAGFYSLDSAFEGTGGVVFDRAGEGAVLEFAKTLSGVRVRELATAGAVPEAVSFLSLYGVDTPQELEVMRRWLENRTFESMRALIGRGAGDANVYLDIHEKYHGPHGLVAGTTGSGKSETLQTYILSLAVNYHPSEVAFILIDYKGGGMAGSFEGLPHVAGIITNLGGNQTDRALASIHSEIKRRQAVFAQYKVKHIDAYISLYREGHAREPMPHLLIIADEFAELKREQPEFVHQLVSASRVGRSLGVHLILATQKPDGVVDDEIWGNAKFRLCLRVQNRQDSFGMLRRYDAAYIVNPGRAYFQVGSDEIFEEIQSGWSGERYDPGANRAEALRGKVHMIGLQGQSRVIRPKHAAGGEEESVTQLTAVLRHIGQVAAQNQVAPAAPVWLPPLPRRLALADLPAFQAACFRDGGWPAPQSAEGLSAVVGLADDPAGQAQPPAAVDLIRDGHLLVAGGGGGGKTAFLQTLIVSLAACYPPSRVQFYIADYGSRTLSVFARLPHVGGVSSDVDPNQTDKTLKLLTRTLARRRRLLAEAGVASYRDYLRLHGDLPAVVYVIDNFAAYLECCPSHGDLLLPLAREAAAYGVYLVVSCSALGDMRPRLRQYFSLKVGLQLAEAIDYDSLLGGRPPILPEGRTPGRGLISAPAPLEFQTALCAPQADTLPVAEALGEALDRLRAAWAGPCAPAVPRVPDDLSLPAFAAYPEIAALSPRLPLGYDLEEAQPLTLALEDTFCFVIAGQAKTGKTNLFQCLCALAAAQGDRVLLFDGEGNPLAPFAQTIGAERYTGDTEGLFALLGEVLVPAFTQRNQRKARGEKLDDETPILLAIHDFTHFCRCVYNSKRDMKGFLELMMKRGAGHRVTVLACLSVEEYRDYSLHPLARAVMSAGVGVLLGGQAAQQQVLRPPLPPSRAAAKLPAGVGWLTDGREARQLITPRYAPLGENEK